VILNPGHRLQERSSIDFRELSLAGHAYLSADRERFDIKKPVPFNSPPKNQKITSIVSDGLTRTLPGYYTDWYRTGKRLEHIGGLEEVT